jgi:hypothetical protein
MKCGRVIKYHIATGRLAKIICQKLMGARGGVYTLKPRQLCAELFFGEGEGASDENVRRCHC